MAQKRKTPSAFAEAFSRAGVTAQDFSAEKGPARVAGSHNGGMNTSPSLKPSHEQDLPESACNPSPMTKLKNVVVRQETSKKQVVHQPLAKSKETKQLLTHEGIKKNASRHRKGSNRSQVKISTQDYLSLLHQAYHPPQGKSAAQQPVLQNIVHFANDAAPNPGAFPIEREMPRLIPELDGIRPSLTDAEDDPAEIYIGLDFGTSSTKVILQDSHRLVPYAVPFAQIGSGNPYLFPSRVYLSGSVYSLDRPAAKGVPQETIRDLKITLLRRPEQVEYMIHATAFLALIIRHARGWLFTAHGDTYQSSQIEWGLNLGLPAEKSEDARLNKRFKAIAVAAINLAARPETITKQLAGRCLVDATRAFAGKNFNELDLTVHPDMVGIFPEIAAQVVGFVESESWDGESRPYITLIDIGAGTVDASFFSVEGKNKRKFRFFQNRVEENGVMNLHRTRIEWLRQMLGIHNIDSPTLTSYLDELYQPTDRLSGIPNSVAHYITGLSITGDDHVDDEFKRLRYRQQLVGEVIRPVHDKRVPYGDHWNDLPVFICGGGSRLPLYGNIVSELNNTIGMSWFRGRRYSLSRPKRLIAAGLSDHEYDRLSVAYGLSFPEIGKIIKSGEVPDFELKSCPKRLQPLMITKDDI